MERYWVQIEVLFVYELKHYFKTIKSFTKLLIISSLMALRLTHLTVVP